jgi:hypothetical protein
MNTLEQLTENMLTGGTRTPAPQGPQRREELAQYYAELQGAFKTIVADLYSLAVNNPENRLGMAGLTDIWKVVDLWRKQYDQAEYDNAVGMEGSDESDRTDDDPNT